ncbi:MAG: hypothetical protein Q9174_000986 [Haloplaca sp. 1 TL-2023]
MASTNQTPSLDTPIAIKLALSTGENRRLKLTLRDLGASTFPDKLRSVLAVSPEQTVLLERFSDSAGAFIALDSNNPTVWKQLYRAAKAKLKLRIKATISEPSPSKADDLATPNHLPSHRYSPPKSEDDSKDANEHLLSGLVAPTASPTIEVKPERQTQASNSRSKLPYDPCLSPSSTAPATQSLLDTVNPVMNMMQPPNGLAAKPTAAFQQYSLQNHAQQDYQMQLMLLEQQNKKRLLMARREQETAAEAPVPHSFYPFGSVPQLSPSSKLSIPEPKGGLVGGAFIISCNKCQANIPNAHWHCSTCNAGDYDLCAKCIEKGILCENQDHWLIKRTVLDGKVVNSHTEVIAPKTKVVQGVVLPSSSKETPQVKSEDMTICRTCNSCVEVFDESKFVTCQACEDFDLCIDCFVGSKHGHHPGHAFSPASPLTKLDGKAASLCAAGRNTRHHAICDGCDKNIYGTRHKCLNCPDWDYCSTCIKGARTSHPGHRFVALNEPISCPTQRSHVHYNINCDGPLCKDNSGYIYGDRYKCAVCHDTDFCAKCEALPTNKHNRTHPLIKFKSPVRNVSVTTFGEKDTGEQMCTMGDQLSQTSSKATETVPVAPSANAATQVQTIAEMKPTATVKEEPKEDSKAPLCLDLQAHFIRDAVADGSVLSPGQQFEQIWTLRNPGPHVWPANCSVRFTGGDTMFNVDPNHPSSVSELHKATESNAITHEVQVGEEVQFTVVMRTPEREGKAISYWRLKDANGMAFGHKLWCDVVVKMTESAKVKKEEDSSESSVHSQMIFPKLDKESTVLEHHEAAAAAPTNVSSGVSVASPVTANEEVGLLEEEIENLDLDDADSTDDGFLTDEEFEMLDASEDDFAEAVNGKQKA